jgi:site-specific DNA recombinase
VIAQACSDAVRAAGQLSDSYHRRRLIASLVARVQLVGQLSISLASESLCRLLGCSVEDQSVILLAPARRVRRGKEVKLVVAGNDDPDRRLVGLLAEARVAQAEVLSQAGKLREVATATGQCSYRLSRLVRLAHLSPKIVDSILAGTQPASLSPRKLLATSLPIVWGDQKAELGFS